MAKSTQRSRQAFARIGSGTGFSLRYRMPQAAERLPGAQFSRVARLRLRWIDYARTHTVSAPCRHFGIARSTSYRWRHRYDPQRLSLLEIVRLVPDAAAAPPGRPRKWPPSGWPALPPRAGARTSWRWCCAARGCGSPSP